VIIGFFLQIFAMYFPPLVRYLHLAYLGLSDWLIVLGEAVVLMMIIEVMKSISSRLNK
jgi:hypothetical protein